MRTIAFALLPLAAFLTAPAAVARQPVRTVAITIDDLPFVNATPADGALALDANRRIQRALRHHSAPATVFVNESGVRTLGAAGTAILQSWNCARFVLANHGFSHADSNRLTLPQIEQELVDGERTIRPLAEAAGRSLAFFRFPYNHLGETDERRIWIEQMLARHHYRLAASTIDTSDYLFARAYDRAIGLADARMAARIVRAYLAYSRRQIAYYGDLDVRVLGYRPPEIILLHLNRLNAAVIAAILRMFRDLHYRFVSLEQAQSDPAYRRPPAIATRFGPMWGYRWARERRVTVDGSREREPPQWVTTYAAGR